MRVFLLTSFPTVSFEAPSPLGLDEVIARCGEHLPDEAMEELDAICSKPPRGSSSFAQEWRDTWQAIHEWNQRERPAADMAEDCTSSSPVDSQVRFDLLNAWEETDPLRRETALLRTKWNWLETKRRLSPYSQEDLFGYVLQVQLLERKDRWQEQAGITQFNTHVRSFLDPVLQNVQEVHA